MSDRDLDKLDTCGCCEGAPEEPAHVNPPGLPEIDYRIGTHPTLLERMTSRIYRWEAPPLEVPGAPPARPLGALKTRASDDPAIALMDAWAVVGDVLTFYQERIANECFLRTATERRSILELARSIGYELNPGVAAETHIAFEVDEAESAPSQAPVPAGTQVQSIPASSDESPQTFESREELIARRSWNALIPRRTHAQTLAADTTRVYLKGAATGLKRGDTVVLLVGGTPHPKTVAAVEADGDAGRTRVDLANAAQDPATALVAEPAAVLDPTQQQLDLTRDNVRDQIFEKTWSEADLQAFLTQHEWDGEAIIAYVEDLLAETYEAGADEFLAFREKAAFFGHNGPAYKSLPAEVRSVDSTSPETAKAFPYDWDNPDWEIWKDSLSNGYYDADADVYLDRSVSGLLEDGWAVLRSSAGASESFRLAGAVDGSRSGFGLSAQVTGLELKKPGGAALGDNATDKALAFKVRKTVAFVKSETLAVAALPVSADLDAGTDTIVLDNMVLGLAEGQAVALRGEEVGAEGQVRKEILVLDQITHGGGRSTLKFENGLAYDYRRDTVKINANLVAANHGETVTGEVLGSGDGARANQRFELKKAPLTYVGAENAAGAESTLSVRVDGVQWEQVSSLYGLDGTARSYVVRIDDDAVASVVFGDGRSGARLPSGQENLSASYRYGIGLAGEVGADRLTLLKTRPFGIAGATNPVEASGGDDPEKLEDARDNAPITVLTLDRIVSLRDYQDFARAYTGIGKALAATVWDGQAERVHLTVADADGDEVVSPLKDRLLAAIEGARDPLRELTLDSFQPFVFFVAAKVLIDEDYLWEDVKAEIEAALLAAFSFEERAFGQPVTAAEVLQVMHGVEAVVAVDLDELYKTAPEEAPAGSLFNEVLDVQVARWDQADEKILPAELLLIHPLGIELSELSA